MTAAGKEILAAYLTRELVLDAIRQVSRFVQYNEDDFIRIVRETSQVQQEETAKAWKKRLAKNEKRITELDTLIRQIYEDKVKGSITEKRFDILSGGYEAEQESLEQECARLRDEIEEYTADSLKTDKFIELVNRYTDFTELTPQMLNEFIEKIVVHEADKSSGERHQQVDIYLNFIGSFKVPEEYDGLSDEERDAQTALEEKRAKQRVANRKCYAKNRSKEARSKKQAEQDDKTA